MDITVKQGEGLTSGIKRALDNASINTSNIDGSIWAKIMGAVSEENKSKPENEKLYKGGSEFIAGTSAEARASWKNNFIVTLAQGATEKIIKISEATWNKIVAFVKGDAPPPQQVPAPPPQQVPATPPQQVPAPPPQQVPAPPPQQVPATPPQQVPAPPPQQVPAPPPQQVPATPPQQVPATPPQQEPTTPQPSSKHHGSGFNKAKKIAELAEQNGGVKHQTRLIDGQKQDYIIYKNKQGETVRTLVYDDGVVENLVQISDNGKKQFVTESKLKAVIGQVSIPDGVKCKCDDKGNLSFSIGNKDATPEQVKEFIKNGGIVASQGENKDIKPKSTSNPIEITPELRGKIRGLRSGVGTIGDYKIDDKGNVSHGPTAVSLIDSDFMKYNNVNGPIFMGGTDPKENKKAAILLSFGQTPSKDFNMLNMQFTSFLQSNAINLAIYQELSAKNPEQLTDGEKKFMVQHEEIMVKLMQTAGEIK